MDKDAEIIRLADDAESAGLSVEDYWEADRHAIGIRTSSKLWYVVHVFHHHRHVSRVIPVAQCEFSVIKRPIAAAIDMMAIDST